MPNTINSYSVAAKHYDAAYAAMGVADDAPFYLELAKQYGGPVLEIGCGTGNLTILAKKTHPLIDVIGSDPDPLALKRARRKARRLGAIRFERGYAQRLPYADGEFDRVLSSMMLVNLVRPCHWLVSSWIGQAVAAGFSIPIELCR